MKPIKGCESEAEYIKRRRKELSETQTLDKMKTSLENSLKNSPWHSKLNESLQRVIHSSLGLKSYQEIFEEIGGGESGPVDVCIEGDNNRITRNFNDAITQAVQTTSLMPHEDLKEKIFNDWDKIIAQEHAS